MVTTVRGGPKPWDSEKNKQGWLVLLGQNSQMGPLHRLRRGTEKKSIHLILMQVAFSNILMLLSKGVPKTTNDFVIINFLGDIGCKVFYLERVARGLTICSTALLTVVQAITMSPRHSWWRRFKPASAWHILPWLLFFWMLNSLISMNLLHFVWTRRTNTSEIVKSENYCYLLPSVQKMNWIFLSLMVIRDVTFQGAMCGASGYIVCLLHKHHQHVLHLQKYKVLCRIPPEIKAAHNVLSLMLCFLFFYLADCIMSLYLMQFLRKIHFTIILQEFLTVGFAIVSPFVMIHRERRPSGCQHSQW
ncbi:putative vomeronasal receptor-like protein 4 [Ctenodactylus gundi]